MKERRGDVNERAKVVPVIVDGSIQLFDIYIDGKWIGSRRTESQCADAVDWALR